jgi:two-component sensor histidine kinase
MNRGARRVLEERIASKQAMARLLEVSNLCVRGDSRFGDCLAGILDAAINLTGADKGNIQLRDAASGALVIAVQRGFEEPFLSFFANVRAGEASACGAALDAATRIVVENVRQSEIFADQAALDVLIQAGVQAVYSTPLISSSGEALGMISMHFGMPHRPGESETQLTDLLARQAADYLERKRAESRQRLLLDELNHRVKNTLATVQSIVAHSLTAASGTDGRKTLEARLIAFSRTHNLLAGGRWQTVSLRDLLLQELGPFQTGDGMSFVVDGPELELSPKTALALGLAFHELATNAAKYGALSQVEGEVCVTWDVLGSAGSGPLHLKWVERGGPTVKKAERRGFGLTVIERGLSLELDGRVELEFDPAGLVCAITIPLRNAGWLNAG